MANENYRFDVWPKENGDVETAEGYFEWSGRPEDLIKRTYRAINGRVNEIKGDIPAEVFEGFRLSGDPIYVAEGENLADVIRAQHAASQRS